MDIKIDFHKGKPIYEQIIEQIKLMISTGTLQPNDKIPTIRNMAKKLGVNPGTVAKAYRDLLKDGYLITRGSGGTYISVNAKKLLEKEKSKLIIQEISECIEKAKLLGITKDEIFQILDKEWNNICLR